MNVDCKFELQKTLEKLMYVYRKFSKVHIYLIMVERLFLFIILEKKHSCIKYSVTSAVILIKPHDYDH